MVALTQWLAGLPLSRMVRTISWVIPLLQTIHILAIGMVLSSVIMIDLRIWGFSRSQTLVQSSHRFLPWLWSGLLLLTVTGIVLLVGEPRRSLLNGTFQLKMLIMALAITATLAFHIALQQNGKLWDGDPDARWKAGIFAAATLVLWLAVTAVGRGRWIANLLPR